MRQSRIIQDDHTKGAADCPGVSDAGHGRPQGDRLFVALEIPEDVKAVLCRLASCFPGLKWTSPAAMHLTLRFIGQVPGAGAEQVQQSLRRVAGGSFHMTVAGLGLFTRKAGGILFAGAHHADLPKLKKQVDEVLHVSAGLSMPEDAFTPHITLSRLKHAASPALKNQVQVKARERFGEIAVTGFTLFRSLLRPAGAVHEPVERYPLPCQP